MTPNPIIALAIFAGIVLLLSAIYSAYQTGFWKMNFRKRNELKTRIEDILKQLYHVEYGGKRATLNAMAGALKIEYDQLVPLIESMSTSGLIHVQGDSIRLTDEGKDYALKIIRVHRLWEKYLSEKTGIHKSEWHQRAEKMEHTLTQEQADDLYQKLGSPRYDPHGDPIPTRSGEIIESNSQPLCSLSVGDIAKIIHIEDEPPVIYKQIIKEKLHIGQQLKVVKSSENNTTFESEGVKHKLSHIIASNIGVKTLNEQEVYEGRMVRLSSLKLGEKAKVIGISRECRGANRRRLMDFGFINGTIIETEMVSPSREPKAYLIKNTLIALRNDQADLILIEKVA